MCIIIVYMQILILASVGKQLCDLWFYYRAIIKLSLHVMLCRVLHTTFLFIKSIVPRSIISRIYFIYFELAWKVFRVNISCWMSMKMTCDVFIKHMYTTLYCCWTLFLLFHIRLETHVHHLNFNFCNLLSEKHMQ